MKKKAFAVLALSAAVLGVVPPASGTEDSEFFELAGRRNWLTFADARPVSPYFGIPGEMRPGIPFARSYLDASPGRSECFAALYYPDEVIEEGVLQTTGHYENQTMARSNNPDLGRGTSHEIAPLGRPGPHASTNNPTRTDCNSEAVSGFGPGEGEVLVDAGFAKTEAHFDRDKLLTDEVVSRVTGVKAGAVRIANLESRLRIEYPLDGEPVVSYAMSIAGLEVDGAPAAVVGDKGVVLAGEQVVARDIIDQFNAEVEKNGAALKDQAVADHIRLVAPTVHEDDDGGVSVTAPAIDAGQANKFRENQQGNVMGVRLGYATAYALLNRLEGASSEVPEDLLGGGAGSPLEPPALDTAPADESLSSTPDLAGDPGSGGLVGSALATAGDRGGLRNATGVGSSGYSTGGGDGGAPAPTAGAGETAAAAGSALSELATTAPAGQPAARLAAVEAARAARHTANGLLGGILVLAGALVWVGGMTLLGKRQ